MINWVAVLVGFASGLLIFVIGYAVGHGAAWKQGYQAALDRYSLGESIQVPYPEDKIDAMRILDEIERRERERGE